MNRIFQFAPDRQIGARQQCRQPVEVGPVAIERGRVQRDHVVAFLDRGKSGIDVGAFGFESLDVAGQGGRVDAGLDDRVDRRPQFPADRGLAALQFAALVAGVARQTLAFLVIDRDIFRQIGRLRQFGAKPR
ncbi:hypothetical protein [Bradyrhizobium sp. S69]|uniref:hypothetical protein n=1 Tax=Bradyrhizobium sp. S69 TaxID=1641856 RepID=UPI001FEEE3C8|nr:hypothetical protein [Bradyrhizobium sp. S69]